MEKKKVKQVLLIILYISVVIWEMYYITLLLSSGCFLLCDKPIDLTSFFTEPIFKIVIGLLVGFVLMIYSEVKD